MTTNTTSNTQKIYAPKVKFEQLAHNRNLELAKQSKDIVSGVSAYYLKHRWWLIADDTMILDGQTGLLWENIAKTNNSIVRTHADMQKFVQSLNTNNLTNWQLPTKSEIKKLVDNKSFPLCLGSTHYKIFGNDIIHTKTETMWLDSNYPKHTFDTVVVK